MTLSERLLPGIRDNNSDDDCRQASCRQIPKIDPIASDKKESKVSCQDAIQLIVFIATSPDCSLVTTSARVKQFNNTPTCWLAKYRGKSKT